MANTVTIDCSGCMKSVRVDIDRGTATAKVPSNGRRGSLHQKGYTAETEVTVDSGEHLAMWDCPWPECGYADSTYATPALRKAMA